MGLCARKVGQSLFLSEGEDLAMLRLLTGRVEFEVVVLEVGMA